ncbi:MAG: hypothetical protein OEY66_07325 [Gammaproteobacteria bacterium]|nr:hypothetical protein [Gammaproteobacteria bacterium]
MPAMNIRDEAADSVERAEIFAAICGGDCYRVNDVLYLYKGVFTKSARRIRNTHCDEVKSIHINGSNKAVILDNRLLTVDEKEKLALDTGFKNFEALLSFFKDKKRLPLDGQLVRWL